MGGKAELMQALRRSRLFQDLGDDDLRALAGIGQEESHAAETVFFREGEEARKLYLILEGRVGVEIEIELGTYQPTHRLEVCELEAGLCFGWSTLVPPYRLTASARALTPVRVLAFERETLNRFLEERCPAGLLIMRRVAQTIASRLLDTRAQLISERGLRILYDEHPAY